MGLIGTFFGWLPLRQTIHFLYPQNIDMSETQHEPASSAFPFRLFVPDALYPTVREVLFQSDVVAIWRCSWRSPPPPCSSLPHSTARHGRNTTDSASE